MATNPLADLKDLHQPAAVSIFPLAPGWDILIIGCILITAVITIGYYLRRKKKAQQKAEIYALLAQIEKNSLENNKDTLAELSILLKRVALWRFPEAQVQLKFANEWLFFLDQSGKTNEFSQGVGKCLANTYQANNFSAEPQALFNLVKKWLRTVL